MAKKELSIGVSFALEQIEHERKVIEAFAKDPMNENVASVTLEVAGIEHIILIHESDYPKLYSLLVELNQSENERLLDMLNQHESEVSA